MRAAPAYLCASLKRRCVQRRRSRPASAPILPALVSTIPRVFVCVCVSE